LKRIAIIPARGGSKRIPNKNIKTFCGKPIISYVLEEAKKSKIFDKIHVSTDSNLIESIVSNLGYEIDFMRPDILADDNTPLQPVIEFVLKNYAKDGVFFDEAWILFPCSPLVEANDLIEASFILNENRNKNINGLIAVVEFPVPIDWAYEITTDGLLNPLNKEKLFIRSQDIEKRFYDSGTFMMFIVDNTSNFSKPQLTNDNFLGYKISKLKGIDIDTKEDWELAESIFSAINFYNKH
jgi:N-acylneuraminate cytidylyltransferase